MKKRFKALSICLVLIMILLNGCGGKEETKGSTENQVSNQETEGQKEDSEAVAGTENEVSETSKEEEVVTAEASKGEDIEFADYEPGSKLEADINMPSIEGPAVAVVWLEDVYLEPNGYDVVTADDLPQQRQVVFIAMSEVKDFKILALTVGAVDENGITYETEEIHSQTSLTPERPLMVGMSCDSTMSRYGFSYVDANGNTVNWEIHVSGVDGAISMSEF